MTWTEFIYRIFVYIEAQQAAWTLWALIGDHIKDIGY